MTSMKVVMTRIQLREQQLLSNQNTHEGKYFRNMRHGEGRLNTADGAQYIGSFQLGLRHGTGQCVYADGRHYDGGWKDDQPFGRGVLRMPNGDVIKGEFAGLEKMQRATIEFATGDVYEGEMSNLRACGQGICKFRDGTTYKGNWLNNCMHGYGQLQMVDGALYEGDFINSTRQGEGRLIDQLGLYEGQFQNDRRHGEGKQEYITPIYSNSRENRPQSAFQISNIANQSNLLKAVYVGSFTQNRRDGYGEMTFSDGSKFRGFYENDLRNGEGEVILHNRKILSYFYNDSLNVKYSKICYTNNNKYSGEVNYSGHPHGEGEMLFENKDVYKGYYENGFQIYGTLVKSNGDKYVGQFKNNMYEGKGTLSVQIIQQQNNQLIDQFNNLTINSKIIQNPIQFIEPNSPPKQILCVYEGLFKNGLKEGHGTETIGIEKYIGQFQNNVKNGKGQQVYKNGCVYTGEFINNQRYGFGQLKYKDGSVYEGQWKNDEQHGDGACVGGIQTYQQYQNYTDQISKANESPVRCGLISIENDANQLNCSVFKNTKQIQVPKQLELCLAMKQQQTTLTGSRLNSRLSGSMNNSSLNESILNKTTKKSIIQ